MSDFLFTETPKVHMKYSSMRLIPSANVVAASIDGKEPDDSDIQGSGQVHVLREAMVGIDTASNAIEFIVSGGVV